MSTEAMAAVWLDPYFDTSRKLELLVTLVPACGLGVASSKLERSELDHPSVCRPGWGRCVMVEAMEESMADL